MQMRADRRGLGGLLADVIVVVMTAAVAEGLEVLAVLLLHIQPLDNLAGRRGNIWC